MLNKINIKNTSAFGHLNNLSFLMDIKKKRNFYNSIVKITFNLTNNI